MHQEKMSIQEASTQFEIGDHTAARWERIYLMEGPEGLAFERRGRGSKGRPTKFPKEVEDDLLKEVQRLRAENAYLKNASLGYGRRATPKQKTMVIHELRREYDLAILLEIAQLPRSTFYYHLKRCKEDKYTQTKEEITRIFHENKGRYVYRRITIVLKSQGFSINHKTFQRLMKELDLVC